MLVALPCDDVLALQLYTVRLTSITMTISGWSKSGEMKACLTELSDPSTEGGSHSCPVLPPLQSVLESVFAFSLAVM